MNKMILTMRRITAIFTAFCYLFCVSPVIEAAPNKTKSSKTNQATKQSKERLVLMPLRVSEEDRNLQGTMETALVEGLKLKYEVFSGEQVARKAKDIFSKESRITTKK